jgi:hypothetical protein
VIRCLFDPDPKILIKVTLWMIVHMSNTAWLRSTPKELIGRKFLMDSEEDGRRLQACVIRAVVYKEEELKNGLEYMKFIFKGSNSTVAEIFTYNDILNYVEKYSNHD